MESLGKGVGKTEEILPFPIYLDLQDSASNAGHGARRLDVRESDGLHDCPAFLPHHREFHRTANQPVLLAATEQGDVGINNKISLSVCEVWFSGQGSNISTEGRCKGIQFFVNEARLVKN